MKSTLGFGKYHSDKIERLTYKDKQYLRWVYYNSSNISFVDEVLGLLSITDKIPKPGTGVDPHTTETLTNLEKKS